MVLRAALISAVLLPNPVIADIVKLSNSGICHDTNSASYNRTKNYSPFDTLEDCVDAGGRLPKGYTPNSLSTTSSEYSRSKFGHGWADVDRDCQDSRTEVLVAHSVSPVKFKTEKKCSVESGRWTSLFTGNTLYSASKIDIDHVVPLKWSWDNGADSWTEDKRKAIANDPANLIAVEASLNRQKGAKGLDEWLPPSNQCQYILRFMRIKQKYEIELTNSKEAIYQSIQNKYCEH
ncbi:hypothetical protein VHA01S_030_00420 [Vibrio halioticoli NBRC 102217]|uniref:GmrSD restriction endonucleases C-terminal domain-containing protein n=1 Tax=Vibrio halioticoli NBRC 102217 TaxID=1219072 RepID=V5FM88_9VIBR|nr:HNH endonuclease family protein [Vibrio halioticoli]GAD89967.1 hypothetical protein VHA01S_030_00420 [Vibrio halioticoli NBRC 102217]